MVLALPLKEEFIDTYYKVFDLALKEEPGFQQIVAGMVMKLLGYIFASQKQKQFSGKPIEKIIQKARFHMRENCKKEVNSLSFFYRNETEPVSIECDAGGVFDWLGVNSDRRIKKNIVDIQDDKALNMLRNIPVRYYNYKDPKKPPEKVLGFIAQEVDKIPELKHLVQYNKTNDLYAMSYEGIIPYLVQSVKELNDRIKVLESK